MKKTVSVFLCVVMLMTALNFVTLPVAAAVDYGWGPNGAELIILGDGAMGDYGTKNSSSGSPISTAPWGEFYPQKVTILSGVTSIGANAFYNNNLLSSLSIADSVKSIGQCAFRYCTGLTRVIIPNGVTSISVGAFSDCTSLNRVFIPNSVTKIAIGAFGGCTGLKTVYYYGTLEEWCSFDIGRDNDPLVNAELVLLDAPETTTTVTETTATATQPTQAREVVAKEEARQLLSGIVGEDASQELQAILEEANKAIESAQTVIDVQKAQREGLQAVIEQLKKEAVANVMATATETTATTTTTETAAMTTKSAVYSFVNQDGVTVVVYSDGTVEVIPKPTETATESTEQPTATSRTTEMGAATSTEPSKTASRVTETSGTVLTTANTNMSNSQTTGTETAAETSATNAVAVVGDSNGDGAVNMKDVLAVRKYLADIGPASFGAAAADVNGDGAVNMKDVLMLRKYLAGIIDKLGA